MRRWLAERDRYDIPRWRWLVDGLLLGGLELVLWAIVIGFWLAGRFPLAALLGGIAVLLVLAGLARRRRE
jgi:hypothetical protein